MDWLCIRIAASWMDAPVSMVTGRSAHDLSNPNAVRATADDRSDFGDVEEEDVGLADDADQPPGIVHDGQPRDVIASHQRPRHASIVASTATMIGSMVMRSATRKSSSGVVVASATMAVSLLVVRRRAARG